MGWGWGAGGGEEEGKSMTIRPLTFHRATYPNCHSCLEESRTCTPWGQRLGVRKRGTGVRDVFIVEWWIDWTDNDNQNRKYRTWQSCESIEDGERLVQEWYVHMVRECLEV